MTAKAAQRVGAGCRFCGGPLHDFVDLGMSPLCESFLAADELDGMEPFYPLKVMVCGECFLAQVKEYVAPERIFREYAYFSSYSTAWLDHARAYADMAVARFRLGQGSRIVELASNDGYLLQFFVAKGYDVLGIDPAENVARAAEAKGVPTLARFFDAALARELAGADMLADLVVGNNVLAQVPDLNGFLAGVPAILTPRGVATFEFPHLLQLIEGNQFDTIYHEHFSYFSLMTAERILAAQGLRVFDVEELWTHGGSLRLFVCHADNAAQPTLPTVAALVEREQRAGLGELATYAAFEERVRETKRSLLQFLIEAKRAGKRIAGYGAPGKGNTLLNYCGVRTDFLDYTVDRNPYKHGRFLPGTHIPVLPPERVAETRPDFLLILPWNLKDEIMAQMAFIREWGGRFVVPIPETTVYG
ncbi:MAG TPA: class I SAM-dependent methyltransferase [Stellaceae bacterium]|nr:class I SAM-dependent methyltransferase [Stellaceae bacterium]